MHPPCRFTSHNHDALVSQYMHHAVERLSACPRLCIFVGQCQAGFAASAVGVVGGDRAARAACASGV